MAETAELLLPTGPLAGLVFAAIRRDTRGQSLSDADRFNHFPASPLVALTLVMEGETRLLRGEVSLTAARAAPPLPPLTVMGPQSRPTTSWNPGPVHVLSVGFYPDAWHRITGQDPAALSDKMSPHLPDPLAKLAHISVSDPDPWPRLSRNLGALCLDTTGPSRPARLTGWAKSAMARAALSAPGQSLRSFERRLKRQSGQTRQTLDFFTRVEDLHRRSVEAPDAALADMAAAAGFADQSHMGRVLRRATGLSPARLNRHIAEDEAFWAYRLLGERF